MKTKTIAVQLLLLSAVSSAWGAGELVAPPAAQAAPAGGALAKPLTPPPQANYAVSTNGAGWQQMLDQYEAERQANLERPAPFGRYSTGEPVMTPAYDALRSLWKAATRDPNSPMTFAQFRAMMEAGPQAVEDGLLALAKSPWGKEWLSHDENAALIGRQFGLRILGYWVTRRSFNPDDGFVRLTR